MRETELLRGLRSVRRFSEREIPMDVLTDVLNSARWTGSSKNSQPWELVVVRDRSLLGQLSRLGMYAGHLEGARAAVVLVMAGPGTEFDEGRLAQNLMLAAWAHGVGSCIASLFPEENARRAKQLLSIPDDRRVHTAISLGYPADEAARRLSSSPPETRSSVPAGRRSLEEIVSWETYGRRAP